MNYIKLISELILPSVILTILLFAVKNKVNAYDEFLSGVKDSLKVVLNIFPAVTGLMVAIGMFRASGLLELVTDFLSPVVNFFNIPKGIIPIAILRPMSGSGGIAMLTDIIKNYGPDSAEGLMASVICGSTETTFYTIAVYFGAVGITDTRHTLRCALIADAVSIICGIFISELLLI